MQVKTFEYAGICEFLNCGRARRGVAASTSKIYAYSYINGNKVNIDVSKLLLLLLLLLLERKSDTKQSQGQYSCKSEQPRNTQRTSMLLGDS